MAKWPFRRKKLADKKVPAEVQEYYDAERRQHSGIAWLIAFLSLLLTVLVAAGLFFGGRWVYRKLAHNSPKAPTKTQQAAQKDKDANQGKAGSEPKKDSGNTQGNSTTGGQTPQTSSTSTNMPHTAPTSGDLPQTGPDSDE